MGRKRAGNVPQRQNNLAVGILFCLFIAVLLMGSLLLKVFDIVRKSTYDGQHRFTVAFGSNTPSPKDTILVASFVPSTASIQTLQVPEVLQKETGSKIVSAHTVGAALAIPVDGFIEYKNGQSGDVASLMKHALFNYRSTSTNLTILDVIRLLLFSSSISSSSIKQTVLTDASVDTTVDKEYASVFSDMDIASEKLSIQIINASDTPGVGNRLARLLTNAGGNVVEVSTGNEVLDKSQLLYAGEMSYTIKKLQRLLHIKATPTKTTGISDIIIKIGKDQLEQGIF